MSQLRLSKHKKTVPNKRAFTYDDGPYLKRKGNQSSRSN